ncbi:MAG TPA: hypothetical protein VEQ59_23715, partial [Polyangiaceae bacterium]|nr:hypothetical protein [Polyangiaceae bacterium]
CTDDQKFGTVPLSVTREADGSLKLTVERERGLRTGSYVFRFSYRTQLLKRELIRRVGSHVELRWVGPRFEDGLDSARVTFRIPEASAAPMLPSPGSSGGTINELDELGGVFVGNLRRTPGKDELEIVRPHVARGEPALWRVWVADSVFESFASAPAPRATSMLTSRELGDSPRERLAWLGGALAAGLAFGLLLFRKWRGFQAAARQRNAEARALIALPPGLRAALGGVLAALAVIAGGRWDEPTLVGALLLGAMACATLYAKTGRALPRGPGQWLPFSEADAFRRAELRLPGAYLDGGTWQGSLVFCALFAAVLGLHFWERQHSPYRAVELLLGAALLLPVFFTGRARELPVVAGTDPKRALERVLRGLRRRGQRAVPLARLPLGLDTPDELRLLVQPRGALSGLMAVEVGADHALGLGGVVTEPYVLLRVREGSPCAAALTAPIVFQRGRKPDERVAVLRPKLPTVTETLALLSDLCDLLTQPAPAAPSSSARISRGKPASARKPARVASPPQAMTLP